MGRESVKRLTLVCACLLLAISPVRGGARTYYVDQSHPGASDNNPGVSPALPWATIAKAAQTMMAGDSAYVRGGTYEVTRAGGAPTSEPERFLPALNPSHDGAPGAPIVFRAHPGETVIIRYAPSEIKRGPLIGSYRRDYIVWDGFTVIESATNDQEDTGPVVIFGESFDRAEHVTIRNCDVRSTRVTLSVPYENHPSIRIEKADDALIENNTIHGVEGDFLNQAGIQSYFSHNVTIQHNEIYDSYTGIFPKGGPDEVETGFTIRDNLIHDVVVGIRTSFLQNSALYRNLLYSGGNPSNPQLSSSSMGFQFAENLANIDCYNNTLVSFANGAFFPSNDRTETAGNQSGINLRSNIFAQVSFPIYDERNTTAMFTSDYNVFAGMAAFIVGYARRSPDQWLGSGADVHSIAADPQFVGAGTRNYQLRPSSPARRVGIDWGDLNANGSRTDRISAGPYVTGLEVIGPLGKGAPEARLTDPSRPPLLHAYPNPSSSSVTFTVLVEGADSTPASIRIFDLGGHWIADLFNGLIPPGKSSITWPRTNRGGGTVAPGYYEVLGTVGSQRVRERIILLP